jgi:1-deoxy-D-xylulose-5-phosphate reductoisomerase
MRVPIQYGLTYPYRYESSFPRFDFMQYPSLTFEGIDRKVFKNLDLAYRALEMGGTASCIFNAANEVANRLFREERIRFTDIADLNEQALERIAVTASPSLEELMEADREARAFVEAAGSKLGA